MVKEALQLLDELAQAVAACARAGPPQRGSARALEEVSGAIAATRAYLHDEFLLLDGSGNRALVGLVRLWRQCAPDPRLRPRARRACAGAQGGLAEARAGAGWRRTSSRRGSR